MYTQDIIPEFKNYILIKQNKRVKYSKKIDLLLAIDHIYSTNKMSYMDRFSAIKGNLINDLFLSLQFYLLKNLLFKNKKEVYLFSDREAYFLDYLKTKCITEGKLVIYYCSSNSYLRIVKLLIEQFIKIFFWKTNKEIGFFLLPNSKNYYFNIYKYFYTNLLDNKYTFYLTKQISSNLSITTDFTLYLEKIFRNSKIKECFFHSIRFPDLFSLSRVLSQGNNNINLISHGSHTTQKNGKSNLIASKSMGIGIAFTKEKNINLLSQSHFWRLFRCIK